MPIYAYKCSSCQHELDVLQKISDAPLSICPRCGAATFFKQLTAAGFQLKGSGWYVTDFKNRPEPEAKPGKKSDEVKPGAATEQTKAAETASTPSQESAAAKPSAPANAASAPRDAGGGSTAS
ncbi:MAG TPA: FmdB family zinc ribbon protein [Burkholderiaceae bacterium]|nr:FmdB family zinc ribbon protein [Burkholderiaceae bacterium]